MLTGMARILSLLALIAVGGAVLFVYRDHFAAQWQLQQQERKIKEQDAVIQRLTSENRVAEVIVTDQKVIDGVTNTTLLFVEYARDGRELLPKVLCVKGKTAHIDALVIKFDDKYVKENDKLRGKSIALFYRVFGDQEKPVDGPKIDEPGHIPDIYRGADPQVSDFEQRLWSKFWQLVGDENLRKEEGVRVAQGDGPWGPFEVGRLYTITLDTNGGLNIRSEIAKGVYREALQRKAGLATAPAP
jgi:hypothetical protein